MKAPIISIVIPTYNCAKFIDRAIMSVLRQGIEDFEIIVVDDGSTDNTRDVVSAFNYLPLSYIALQNNGVANARNEGIKAARGEYIAYVDADDELDDKMLTTCLEHMQRFNGDWCITDILKIVVSEQQDSNFVERSPVPSIDVRYEILREDFVLRSPFFRRQALLDVGLYDTRLRTREDWDMSIRFIWGGYKYCYIDEPLYRYYIRTDSLMRKSKKLTYDCTLTVLHKHHRRYADAGDRAAAKIYANNIWWLGREYLTREKDIMKFAYCVMQSMKYDFNVRRLVNPVLSCFGLSTRSSKSVSN